MCRKLALRSKCTLKREEVLTFLRYGQNREEKGQHSSLGMASGSCWGCSQSIFEVECLQGKVALADRKKESMCMDNTRALHDSLGGENRTPLRVPGRAGLLGLLPPSPLAPLQFTTQRASAELIPGQPTQLLVYRAEQAGNTFLNPSLVVQRNTTLAVDLFNHLDEGTTIHWHGLDVEWTMDGHPLHTVAPGATYQYRFVVRNRGGTYWYHSHAHERTAQQVYRGLAGFLLVEDEEQYRLARALDLTLGETDIPLLLQDKLLDAQGQISYPTDAESQAMGVEGTTILTNLTINPLLPVTSRLYRFRLLNGSNARTFR